MTNMICITFICGCEYFCTSQEQNLQKKQNSTCESGRCYQGALSKEDNITKEGIFSTI